MKGNEAMRMGRTVHAPRHPEEHEGKGARSSMLKHMSIKNVISQQSGMEVGNGTGECC